MAFIRTVGVVSNRDGIGARIKVITGDIHQIREVSAGSSYLSQNSPEVEFGLGKHDKVDKVIIQWSSGTIQTLTNVDANQRLIVSEKAE